MCLALAACAKDSAGLEEMIAECVAADAQAVVAVDISGLKALANEAGVQPESILPVDFSRIDPQGIGLVVVMPKYTAAVMPLKDPSDKEKYLSVAISGNVPGLPAMARHAATMPVHPSIVKDLCAGHLLRFYTGKSPVPEFNTDCRYIGWADVSGTAIKAQIRAIDASGNSVDAFGSGTCSPSLSKYAVADANAVLAVGNLRETLTRMAGGRAGVELDFVPATPALLTAKAEVDDIARLASLSLDGAEFALAFEADDNRFQQLLKGLRDNNFNPQRRGDAYVYRIFTGTRPRPGRDYWDDDYYEDVYAEIRLTHSGNVGIIANTDGVGDHGVQAPDGKTFALSVSLPPSMATAAIAGKPVAMSLQARASESTLDIDADTGVNPATILKIILKTWQK